MLLTGNIQGSLPMLRRWYNLALTLVIRMPLRKKLASQAASLQLASSGPVTTLKNRQQFMQKLTSKYLTMRSSTCPAVHWEPSGNSGLACLPASGVRGTEHTYRACIHQYQPLFFCQEIIRQFLAALWKSVHNR